jgi:hypothetical protein
VYWEAIDDHIEYHVFECHAGVGNKLSHYWTERVMTNEDCIPSLFISPPMNRFNMRMGREIKLEIEFEVSLENPALISSYSYPA